MASDTHGAGLWYSAKISWYCTELSHKENRSVAACNGVYYASGWKKPVRLPQLYHDGTNPGFSAIMRIRLHDKIGIFVLDNLNTIAVEYIADTKRLWANGLRKRQSCQFRFDNVTHWASRLCSNTCMVCFPSRVCCRCTDYKRNGSICGYRIQVYDIPCGYKGACISG